MNPFEIENKIKTFAQEIFGFDLSYYKTYKKREIVGIKYSKVKYKVLSENCFFSSNKDALLFYKILKTIDNNSGYFVAAYSTSERLKNTSLTFNKYNSCFSLNYFGNFDLFIVNKELLKKSELVIDLILLHEICHMLVDSGYLNKIELKPSKIDKNRGEILLDNFRLIGDSITHNEKFCNLLAAAVRKYDDQNINNNLWSAVKYNFAYNPDTRKKVVLNSLKKIVANNKTNSIWM